MHFIFFTLRLISFFVFVTIISSCEYQPSGTYFNEVEPVLPNSLEIDIADFDDTIFVHQQGINLNFDYSALNRKVFEATASIADKELEVGLNYSNKVTVYLPALDYATGYYFLNLHLVVHSGTGSLHNKLESEFFEATIYLGDQCAMLDY